MPDRTPRSPRPRRRRPAAPSPPAASSPRRSPSPAGGALPRPASARGYHHGDLRRALLDAALALVEEDGLAALSLREVAKRAGVTHAAPYHHFADRAAVMAAIAHEGHELLRDRMDGCVAALGDEASADQRLAACGRGYLRFALEHPAHFRVMFRPELLQSLPALSPGARSAYQVIDEAVHAMQAAGLAPPVDHDLLVISAWSTVHGLAALLLDGPLRLPGPHAAAATGVDHLVTAVPDLCAALWAAAGPHPPPRRRKR